MLLRRESRNLRYETVSADRTLMYLGSTSYCVGGVVSLRRQRRHRRRWGQLEGDALPAEAADAEQDAAEDGEQEI